MKELPLLLVLALILIAGCLETPTDTDTGTYVCIELEGSICSETSTETCNGSWLDASDSNRCCSGDCVAQPLCEIDLESGKPTYCICEPNENKDKVTIIIIKDSVFDDERIEARAQEYFESVKLDLNIDNIGISKFDGDSIDELDTFIEELYLEEDVAYAIILQDELRLFGNGDPLNDKFPLVGREWNLPSGEIDPTSYCKDVALSRMLAPILYSDEEKVQFISNVLSNFAAYHRDPSIINQYKKSFLHIKHDPSLGSPVIFFEKGYTYGAVEVFNTNHSGVKKELKEKHVLLIYDVHGSELSVGLGLNYYDYSSRGSQALYTELDEYSRFVNDSGTPALFVDAGACQATMISYAGIKHCCWPQIQLESGTWAYYSIGGSGMEILQVERAFITEKSLGHAIRKNPGHQMLLFGDVLAHFPKP